MMDYIVDHGTSLVVTTSAIPSHLPAASFGTWDIILTASRALARGTRIGLARRWPSDWGVPQGAEPGAADYLTVGASSGIALRWWQQRLYAWHPVDHAVLIELLGDLAAGESVTIRFGDRAQGSPGARAQTFIEEESPLSVRVLPAGESRWIEVARPGTRIVGTVPHRLVAIAPSIVAPGERFAVRMRLEDAWGNPASDAAFELRLESDCDARARLDTATGSIASLTTSLTREGVHRLRVVEASGRFTAETNAIRCVRSPARRVFWGDIHGQSLIGCGARSVENYFRHARDFALVDFSSHQANCFLVSNPEWAETERVTAAMNETGRFTTLLGLEWSATRNLGGDHNLYFPGDTAPITRCSHEFVADRGDVASDLPHITDVHRHYSGTDTLIAVHVGGRSANLDWYAPELERLLEIHSTHATSEWFLFDALARGYRFGVIAGSDGVDGRPGASHPGHMNVRNVRGGLTAVMMPENSRASLWEALKARRCYATTGERILISFAHDGRSYGESVTAARSPRFIVDVAGTAPLRAIELFRGTAQVASAELRPRDPIPSNTLRLSWSGLTLPGTWDRARMLWHGRLDVTNARILSATGWAFDTPDEGIVAQTDHRLTWRSVTAGDWDGVEVTLDDVDAALLDFAAGPMTLRIRVADLAQRIFDVSDENPARRVRIERLPRGNTAPDWCGELIDEAPPQGEHAYWLRITQDDGAMAWTSPVFVAVTR
jgi:hypothetical protein